MPKYMVAANYTPDGIKGVASGGGTARSAAVAELAQAMGGSLEAFYFAFGEADAYVIVDLPDNEAAAAVAMAVNGSGAVTISTTVLMTPEEVDAAAQRVPGYRAPGS